ncbi:MAG: S8 family serine peptidase [Culturomica sp.]|jgi:subtilisin family serine protease|nr:S8 family serine peptidase [Culturomica sp.]
MKLRQITLLVLIFLFAACNKDEIQDATYERPDATFNEKFVNQGLIRVKFNQETQNSIRVQTRSGAVSTGIATVDEAIKGLNATSIKRTFPDAGANEWKAVAMGLDRWYDIRFDTDVPVTRAFISLKDIEEVDVVEPDFKIQLVGDSKPVPFNPNTSMQNVTPSAAPFANPDPYYSYQWHYSNTGALQSAVAGADINLPAAWEKTTGNSDVIVAIVDGGIQYDHEDLAANMWQNNQGEYGFNYVDMSTTIVPHSHGTHVAGTVAAVNGNDIGVCGVAGGNGSTPGIRLMSCQIFKANPQDPSKDLGTSYTHQAVKYGADNGAVISQNSWGYVWDKNQQSQPPTMSQVMRDAIDYFIEYAGTDHNGDQVGPMKGGVVIFAAGNDATSYKSYPAAYDKVISVASFAPNFLKAYYSNYGTWVTLSAPGGDAQMGGNYQVLSTTPGNSYAWMQGTSMACPHVSGVAALVVSENGGPGFTADKLKEMLINSCKDIDKYHEGRSYYQLMGRGYIDASAAISSIIDDGTLPDPVDDFTAIWKANKVTLTWTVTKAQQNTKPVNYNVYTSTSPLTEENLPISSISFPVGDKSVGDAMEGIINGLTPATHYYIAINCVDKFGNVSKSAFIDGSTGTNEPPTFKMSPETEMILKAHETKTYRFVVDEPEDEIWNVSNNIPESEGISLQVESDTVFYMRIRAPYVAAGTYTDTLTVTDETGAYTKLDVNFTVLPNHSPVTKPVSENETYMFFNSVGSTLSLNLGHYFSDADGENLNYTVTPSATGFVNINQKNDSVFDVKVLKTGRLQLTLAAADMLSPHPTTTTVDVYSRDGSQEIELYPNPVRDFLNIRVGQGDDGRATVIVYSTSGAKAMEVSNINVTAFNPGRADLSKLPAGTYNIEVKLQTGNTTKEVKRNIVKL